MLVVNAFTKMAKQIENDAYNYIALFVAFVIATLTDFNVIFLILAGAVCGIIITLIKDQTNKNKPLVVAQRQDLSQDGTTEEVQQ